MAAFSVQPSSLLGNKSVGRRAVIDYSRQLLPSARQESSSDSFGAMLTQSWKRPPSSFSWLSPGLTCFSYSGGFCCMDCKSRAAFLWHLCSPPGGGHWHRPLSLKRLSKWAILASLQDGAGRKLSGVQCQTHDVCSFYWEHWVIKGNKSCYISVWWKKRLQSSLVRIHTISVQWTLSLLYMKPGSF